MLHIMLYIASLVVVITGSDGMFTAGASHSLTCTASILVISDVVLTGTQFEGHSISP